MSLVSSLIGVFPKRGFVRPEDSQVLLGPSAAPRDAVYLALDAMISETPEYDAHPTKSQVEDGETISDHVMLEPIKLHIQGIVTNTPVSYIREFSSVFATPSPAKAAHIFLKTLYDNRIPFDFVGGLDVYKSMVITKYSPTNTAETGDALRFTCTMEQVRTVSSQLLVTNKKASPKTSQGTQNLGPSSPTEQKAVVDAAGDTTNAAASNSSLGNAIAAQSPTAKFPLVAVDQFNSGTSQFTASFF